VMLLYISQDKTSLRVRQIVGPLLSLSGHSWTLTNLIVSYSLLVFIRGLLFNYFAYDSLWGSLDVSGFFALFPLCVDAVGYLCAYSPALLSGVLCDSRAFVRDSLARGFFVLVLHSLMPWA
jgi:hypothetical protein